MKLTFKSLLFLNHIRIKTKTIQPRDHNEYLLHVTRKTDSWSTCTFIAGNIVRDSSKVIYKPSFNCWIKVSRQNRKKGRSVIALGSGQSLCDTRNESSNHTDSETINYEGKVSRFCRSTTGARRNSAMLPKIYLVECVD